MTTRVRLLIALCRPPVAFLLALYTELGMAAAGQAENHLLAFRGLVPMTAFLLFSAACNDLADVEIDRVNLPTARNRPLVAAGVRLRTEMITVAAVAGVIALVGGLALGPGPAAVMTVGLCVSAGYSLRPVRLADRGAVAAVTLPVCFVAVPFLTGRLAVAPRLTGRDLLLLTALYVGFIGRILLKDFRDVRGDTLFGKRTYLVRHGRDRTCRFSAACWTLGAILLVFATPHRTVAFTVAIPVLLAAALWLLNRLRTETHPRREAALISATAIVGRGILMVLLVHLATQRVHWPEPARAATIGALLIITLGQASVMVRRGPVARRLRVPTIETAHTALLSTADRSTTEPSATSQRLVNPTCPAK